MTIVALLGILYFFYSGGTIAEFILVRVIAIFFTSAHTIGSHRWLCHFSFQPSTFGKYFMLSGLVVTGYGKPLHLAIAHTAHHKNSDTELDPHSPKYNSFLRLWLGRYNLQNQYEIPKRFMKEKEAIFVTRYYWHLFWAFNIILSLIDFKTALIFTPINFVYSWTMNTVINYYGHKKENTFAPKNLNAVLTFLTLGEGLHANHHKTPSSYNFSLNGEIDWGKRFIDTFLIKRQ
jgi:stearoyl-CoA desaturase (delta-9 desaturase)